MNSPTGLQDVNSTLSQLAARQSRLESRLIALERAKQQARRDVERTQRDHFSHGADRLRDVPEPVARRLETAQRALESVESERHEIEGELPGIRLARGEIIRRAASPAWVELQRHQAETYAIAMALAAEVEALVEPYSQAVEETAIAKAEFDTLLATLGQDAQQIRKDLVAEMSETVVPDTPEERQALRRADRIRNVFSQELSYKW